LGCLTTQGGEREKLSSRRRLQLPSAFFLFEGDNNKNKNNNNKKQLFMRIYPGVIATILLLVLTMLLEVSGQSPSAESYAKTPFQRSIVNKYRGKDLSLGLMRQGKDALKGSNFWKRRLEQFQNITGANTEGRYLEMDIAEFDKAVMDDVRSFRKYGIFVVFGITLPEVATKGLVVPLDTYVERAPTLEWQDIFLAQRWGSTFDNKIFSLPVDGDQILMVYRNDLLKRIGVAQPTTWEELASAAERLNGTDFNGDGEVDYPVCMATLEKNDITNFMFYAIAASYIQKLGRQEGLFFDPITLKPKSETPEFLEAMKMVKRLVHLTAFPGKGEQGFQEHIAYALAGRCAFFINFPGPSRVLIQNQLEGNLTGKLSVAPLPGTACKDSTKCPYAEKGVNYSPFLAMMSAGCAVGVHPDPLRMQAAFDFCVMMSEPESSYEMIAERGIFLDPFRHSHVSGLEDPTSRNTLNFLKEGWEPRQLPMIKGYTDKYSNENCALDLAIPGQGQYMDVAVNPFLVRYWRGESSVDEAMKRITEATDKITDRYGRNAQRAMYRASLGLPSLDADSASLSSVDIVPIVVPIVVILGSILGVAFGYIKYQAWQLRTRTRDISLAPQGKKTAMMFTDVQQSTKLWNSNKVAMEKAIQLHHQYVRRIVTKHKGYEVKTIGDSFMVVHEDATALLRIALEIHKTLLLVDWPVEILTCEDGCQHTNDEGKILYRGLRIRIGLHYGEVNKVFDEVAKGYDYYGDAVNCAARVESVAFGGQTAVSQDFLDQVDVSLKREISQKYMGKALLKGINQPVPITGLWESDLDRGIVTINQKTDLSPGEQEPSQKTESAEELRQEIERLRSIIAARALDATQKK